MKAGGVRVRPWIDLAPDLAAVLRGRAVGDLTGQLLHTTCTRRIVNSGWSARSR